MPNLSKISHPTGILWVLMLLSFMQWICFTLNQVSNHVYLLSMIGSRLQIIIWRWVLIFSSLTGGGAGVFFLFPFFLEITNVNLWQEGHFMKPLSWIQQLLMLILWRRIWFCCWLWFSRSNHLESHSSDPCNAIKAHSLEDFLISLIYKDISAILSRFLHSHFILSPPSSSRAAHLWVRHANTVTDCINWMEVCPMFLTSTVYYLLTVLVIY